MANDKFYGFEYDDDGGCRVVHMPEGGGDFKTFNDASQSLIASMSSTIKKCTKIRDEAKRLMFAHRAANAVAGGGVEDFRLMDRFRKMKREMFGADCPRCREQRPKAHPSKLLPGGRCNIDRYRDPRPYLTKEQEAEAWAACQEVQ